MPASAQTRVGQCRGAGGTEGTSAGLCEALGQDAPHSLGPGGIVGLLLAPCVEMGEEVGQ